MTVTRDSPCKRQALGLLDRSANECNKISSFSLFHKRSRQTFMRSGDRFYKTLLHIMHLRICRHVGKKKRKTLNSRERTRETNFSRKRKTVTTVVAVLMDRYRPSYGRWCCLQVQFYRSANPLTAGFLDFLSFTDDDRGENLSDKTPRLCLRSWRTVVNECKLHR